MIMRNIGMIHGGFDPAFIDINIRPMNEKDGRLISDLPPLGSHHTLTDIVLIPGGNGFNLCRTLASVGHQVTYVGPSSQLYENLIKENNIPLTVKPIKNAEVNFTGVLNLQGGEIQFNSVKGKLSTEHLSEDLLDCYMKSPLKCISNVALNTTSIEWISSLILSLWSLDFIECLTEKNPPQKILNEMQQTDFEGILFIDPSDITHFTRIEEFITFLKETSKLLGEKYLSVNENELKRILDVSQKTPDEFVNEFGIPIIYHSASEIIFYGKDRISLKSKELTRKTNFVGAGDCFNGMFLNSVFQKESVEDSLQSAINGATHLIETGNYPT